MERVEQSRHGLASRVDETARERLRGWVREQPDRTIAEPQALLGEHGVRVSWTRVAQLLPELGLRRKKTLHALERDAEGNQKRRTEYLREIAAVAPERLIFVDESGVTTSLTRLYGRSEGGGRIREATPGGRWSVLTMLGALSLGGVKAMLTIAAPTDGDIFCAFLTAVLCPRLAPGDVVVLDNLGAHKVAGVRERVERRGARLLYLPAYGGSLEIPRAERASPAANRSPPSSERCSQCEHRGSDPAKSGEPLRPISIPSRRLGPN